MSVILLSSVGESGLSWTVSGCRSHLLRVEARLRLTRQNIPENVFNISEHSLAIKSLTALHNVSAQVRSVNT